MSLFEIQKKPEQESEMNLSHTDGSEFINTTAFRSIKKHIGTLEANRCYHLLSKGSWSLYELIVFLVKQIGSCRLTFSTWAISEEAALTFCDLKEKNMLTSISGIFDHTTESHKNSALTICRSYFDKIAFAHLHAKVTILQNDQFKISIVSTANMTTNPRYERTVVFTNPIVAAADENWLKQLLC